eukprot:303117_1
MTSENIIYSMTLRNPWAYLMAKGYKKIENRHKGISSAKLDQPIALHVALKRFPSKERHGYYALPLVQKCLKMDQNTKDIASDYKALDDFFLRMAGSIIAIVFIHKTIKSAQNRAKSKYEFSNVPHPAAYHWIISKRFLLPSPITNYSGNLGVLAMKDNDAIKSIQTFLHQHRVSELKRNHLFVPEHMRKHPQKYLIKQGRKGNVMRLIYDSEEDDVDKQCSDDKENNKASAMQTVINNVNRACISKYIASDCGLYWIRNCD